MSIDFYKKATFLGQDLRFIHIVLCILSPNLRGCDGVADFLGNVWECETASNSSVYTHLKNACWGSPQTRATSGQLVPK
jgi:hypothetical protein